MIPPSTHIPTFPPFATRKSASRVRTHPKKQRRELASSVQHEEMGMLSACGGWWVVVVALT